MPELLGVVEGSDELFVEVAGLLVSLPPMPERGESIDVSVGKRLRSALRTLICKSEKLVVGLAGIQFCQGAME